jgi:hypothetical protein
MTQALYAHMNNKIKKKKKKDILPTKKKEWAVYYSTVFNSEE